MLPRLALVVLLLLASPLTMSQTPPSIDQPPASQDAGDLLGDLHLAVISLQVAKVQTLLESGVDPNAVSRFGQGVPPLGSALRYASPQLNTDADRRKARKIMELLMRHGADPGLPGPDDWGKPRTLREYARHVGVERELEKLEKRYRR
jgi:ankyrin repeat protein